ncbi:MAG: M23 family metallopeptidase [Spirochaetes bacterium]|nr:M23 family metallopeptidase [Spirochaetota bacterium]
MSAIVLLLLLVFAGAPSAEAIEPTPTGPVLRIVPAVRYDRLPADGDGGSFAPRVRSLLAWYQDAAPPGGLAVVYTPESRESFPTVLMDGRGRILSRGTSFRWGTGWLSLIGVPPTARPGGHELWLPGIHLPFRVTARTFASETIPLSSTLTTLRTQPDPRKTAEAVELARLLAGADPAAVHETGAFALPLAKPRRTAGYGDRREYLYDDGRTDLSVHNGVDLALPEGTPVAACGSGRVVMAKERIVTGWTVVIEHLPGLYSLYCHLSAVNVREGELLTKGQILGTVGKTGLATGPHLHWEVEAGGVAVDPDLLTAGLPLVPGRWPIPAAAMPAAAIPAVD